MQELLAKVAEITGETADMVEQKFREVLEEGPDEGVTAERIVL